MRKGTFILLAAVARAAAEGAPWTAAAGASMSTGACQSRWTAAVLEHWRGWEEALPRPTMRWRSLGNASFSGRRRVKLLAKHYPKIGDLERPAELDDAREPDGALLRAAFAAVVFVVLLWRCNDDAYFEERG